MTSARTDKPDLNDWQTPSWLFEKLDQEFHFDLDPAATEKNALCKYYFDKEADGLKSDWFGNVYVNCPYSELKKWVEKGWKEATQNPKVTVVVMLIAARTDTRAWWNYIRFGEIRFLKGRLKFEHLNGAKNSAPFPSAIVIFGKGIEAKTVYWEVEK